MVTWGVAGERVGRDGGEALDWDGETADPIALVHQFPTERVLPETTTASSRSAGPSPSHEPAAVDAMVTRVKRRRYGTVDSPTTLQEGEYLSTMQAVLRIAPGPRWASSTTSGPRPLRRPGDADRPSITNVHRFHEPRAYRRVRLGNEHGAAASQAPRRPMGSQRRLRSSGAHHTTPPARIRNSADTRR